jgi:hypothetical protein
MLKQEASVWQGEREAEMVKDGRLMRRLVGMILARLQDAGLERVEDPRARRGRRWPFLAMLRVCVIALASGRKSLAEAEALTDEMSHPLRSKLGIRGRMPDTTLRATVVRVRPSGIRQCIRHQVHNAERRKALTPQGLPFGVVAIDGKSTALEAWDHLYAQRQVDSTKTGACGLLRTLTCSLVSSRAKVVIDAMPIPPATNEMGHFQTTLLGLIKSYDRGLFRVVSTDAGMCSLSNASAVVAAKKDYLFALKGDQPTLLAEAKRLLGEEKTPLAQSEDVVGKYMVTRRLYRTSEMAGYLDWEHLETLLRVESEKREIVSGQVVEHEERYFISSLKAEVLSDKKWLLMVRMHWGVENQCHNTWDTAFQEDDRPWIEMDPQGALVVALLRRLVYNMMALFRSVTQRSEEKRQTPWKDLLRWMYNALIGAREEDLAGLRPRQRAVVPS